MILCWCSTTGTLCSKLYAEMEGALAGLNLYDVLQDCFHTNPSYDQAYQQVSYLPNLQLNIHNISQCP